MKYMMVHGKKIRNKLEEKSFLKEILGIFKCKFGLHRTLNNPLEQKRYCWYCNKYLGKGCK